MLPFLKDCNPERGRSPSRRTPTRSTVPTRIQGIPTKTLKLHLNPRNPRKSAVSLSRASRQQLAASSELRIQHVAHQAGEGGGAERFLQERSAVGEHAVVQHGVVGVSRHENYLH